MTDFIIEGQIEKVVNPKTKEYLEEVISSYYNGNYRATVVVLYTTVIYDLLQKVSVLKNMYNDKGAKEIIDNIINKQTANPKNPEWEVILIEDICKKTKLISDVEKEELLYLKNQRNFAAHPIVTTDGEYEELELRNITKETASDLIRKAFEIVFLRDAILAKDLVEDIVADLNEFYNRVGTDGLKNYLNTKYYRRMTQSRKDVLFKSLWKFVFVLKNTECDRDRKANYYGLLFLYEENKQHYHNIIKKDEDSYFGKMEVETIESWSEKINTDINFATIAYFQKMSRIVYLIKFIEQCPEIYNIFNSHAKNILLQSINHMYCKESNINYNSELGREQLKLEASTVFISQDVTNHFKMILEKTSDWWYVLETDNLDAMLCQTDYRGNVGEFLKFLLEYCAGANSYRQAADMFSYIRYYKEYLKIQHFYMILAGMNSNSQYYNNNFVNDWIEELKNMFFEKFKTELFTCEEEYYLYNRLFQKQYKNCDVEKLMLLIEQRANYFPIWSLQELIFEGLYQDKISEYLHTQSMSSYSNIIKTLENENEPNYKEWYVKKFRELFQ